MVFLLSLLNHFIVIIAKSSVEFGECGVEGGAQQLMYDLFVAKKPVAHSGNAQFWLSQTFCVLILVLSRSLVFLL